MKIFVSVGTHEKGFARLITSVLEIRSHQVTVQFGSTDAKLLKNTTFTFFDFCSFEDMTKLAVESDLIIGSASPGLANLAWLNNCVYIGVARLNKFEEAVDDHQLDFLEHLSKFGGCLPLDLTGDINEFLRTVEPKISELLDQQKKCQTIFSDRMQSVEKSVIDFFAH